MSLRILDPLRRRVAVRRMRALAGLPIAEAFDRIYERGIWSNDKDEPSGGGSYGRAADQYVEFVTSFIDRNAVGSIIDIGCGDFNVGARIAPQVPRYLALDVSARIIEINKSRFASMRNVEFRQADACVEQLPRADLITVRQVLQHLANAQIESILQTIERAAPKFTLITEHLIEGAADFRANADLPGHSAHTRIGLGSGVVLSEPPFSRRAARIGTIALQDVEALPNGPREFLGIFLLSSS